MSNIYEIFGTDAHAMTLSLMEAANVADMIPDGHIAIFQTGPDI